MLIENALSGGHSSGIRLYSPFLVYWHFCLILLGRWWDIIVVVTRRLLAAESMDLLYFFRYRCKSIQMEYSIIKHLKTRK